jgi:curved DNA-binding protein CbpA
MDYYALLGIPSEATIKEITKAYRVKALALHPDKNLDNPNASTLSLVD